MSSILDKIEFTQKDIEDIIASRTEESINIDFKDARALSSGDGKEISKDVSAFANSDGGLIFYGINENNHVADSVSFVDGNKYNKEWLENKITSNIQQKIDNLLIIPVRFDDDINKTVYVVKIPKSANTPHMNSFDNKYYRRFNFKSVPMEEYEIRDSYFRVGGSKVVIKSYNISEEYSHSSVDVMFSIEVQISNLGKLVAEKYKISCSIISPIYISYYDTEQYTLTKQLDGTYTISTNIVAPLFPEEVLNVMRFKIKFSSINVSTFLETLKIGFSIFNNGSYEVIDDNLVVEEIKKILRIS